MTNEANIAIIGHRAADGGWGTHAPQVRGVFGHGDTFEDAVVDWHRAAEGYRETFGRLDVDADVAAVVEPQRLGTA